MQRLVQKIQALLLRHKAPIEKATREAGRVVLLAVLPLAIYQLETDALELKVLLYVGLVALLKWLDKLLHEVGKESGNERLKKGLTRF